MKIIILVIAAVMLSSALVSGFVGTLPNVTGTAVKRQYDKEAYDKGFSDAMACAKEILEMDTTQLAQLPGGWVYDACRDRKWGEAQQGW